METRYGKFVMLCGIPASGKSTLSKKLLETGEYVVLSSDEIREELTGDVNNQEANVTVFDVMNQRTVDLLNSGKNVIYDATNINRKRRKHLINHVIKANEKVIYYINEHIDTIRFRDIKRSRTVGDEPIDRMYKTLHIPVLNEGWDEVNFVSPRIDKYLTDYRYSCESVLNKDTNHDDLFKELGRYIRDFTVITDLPQDSKYHSFSVSRHTYHVYKYIKENYNESNKTMMLWAAVLHDLGKGFCKSFVNHKGEETKHANFIGHEYVSSQLAAYWLSILGYDDKFIKDVVTLTQFHMYPMNASEKKMKEINMLLGDELFNKLMILHEADLQAK
ncbi:AAA family ATPase [Bacillus sp. Wb]